MSNFVLAEERYAARVLVRAWEPGDGLSCSFSKAAPRELPCGPPVAVTVTEDPRQLPRGRYNREKTQRVVCRNHTPGLIRPNEVNAEAKKAAAERLIVEHWDTYQRYIDQETQARQDKALEFADPEIRRIVLGDEDGTR